MTVGLEGLKRLTGSEGSVLGHRTTPATSETSEAAGVVNV